MASHDAGCEGCVAVGSTWSPDPQDEASSANTVLSKTVELFSSTSEMELVVYASEGRV